MGKLICFRGRVSSVKIPDDDVELVLLEVVEFAVKMSVVDVEVTAANITSHARRIILKPQILES